MKTQIPSAVLLLILFSGPIGCGSGAAPASQHQAPRFPPLQSFDNGAFSLQVPANWNMAVAGDCASLAFVLRDPQEPLRMVLFFGMVGPVYQTHAQRQIDLQYMSAGGFPVDWIDMPVVDPLVPENFLAHFPHIASSQIARRFMPACPRFDGFQAVSSTPLQPPLAAPGARAARVRGVFAENGRAAQGLFSLATAPGMPMKGGPGGGTAYGYLLAGIAAPVHEFETWQPFLLQALASYAVHPHYARDCMMRSEAAFRAVAQAGQTLRDTSDMIVRSWEARNRIDDVVAQKRSDAILGRERLHDPASGQVFEFENGFYDRYRLDPQSYRNSRLEPLPQNDHGLWTAPPLDGRRELGLQH